MSARLAIVVLASLVIVPRAPAQDAPAATGQESKPATEIVVPGVRRLTIGGQYRLRYENRIDPDFDRSSNSAGHSGFFTQRVRLDVGVEFDDDLGPPAPGRA